jgi:Ca2+-binding RTX toxin-like protein
LHLEGSPSGLDLEHGYGVNFGYFEILNLFLTPFDDTIVVPGSADGSGRGIASHIYAGDGNDYLTSFNLQQTTLDGGAGDDKYLIQNTNTKLVDASGDDFATTKVNYTIDAGIETVALALPGLTVTGNSQDNHVWGSDGNDTIYGMAGSDLIGGKGGDDTIDGGAHADVLYGDGGNDRLLGGSSRDYLDGGADNDVLIGGADHDVLIGGTGADVFEFDNIAETSVIDPDRIADFNHTQSDLIDLSRIDATLSTPSNDAFAFLGTAAFTGHEGELRYSVTGSDALIEGDVNGDGVADFAILLNGVSTLNHNDFVL